MGEAKRRGTKEEREFKALQAKVETMGMQQMTMESICSQFEVTENASPMGYIIRINYDDEVQMQFLSTCRYLMNKFDLQFSFYPGNSYCFENFDELVRAARFVAKSHKTDICYLFQSENQFEVVPVITVDSPRHE